MAQDGAPARLAETVVDEEEQEGEEEEEVEYVFVSFEGVRPQSSEPLVGSSLVIDNIHTDNPTISIRGDTYHGRFEEDLGSTLFFDRSSLKRVADAQRREVRDLVLERTDEKPLVCVATKRLCLRRRTHE